MRDLNHLLKPQSVAVIGGGAWCEQVVVQLDRFGFKGDIWPVHPKRAEVAGHKTFASLENLPTPPDATFVGINRHATIDAICKLSAMGAGGATCFASGFSEAAAEDDSGTDLQQQLIEAAGEMPILGPNCYGFINALDHALIWPDQHGCTPVETGVAILTQSSNISINLTMQQRALPIAYMIACGNMAQTSQAQIASALLDDPRVTAIGVHIEGFHDLRDWEALAEKAYAKGVPIVALKVGASDQAQAATISHTASLAGSDAGAQAFLNRLGIPRLRDLPSFIETLKLMHCHGPLDSNHIASISCSGGEASLIADMVLDHDLTFPALTDLQHETLREALGPMVALSNPLDYHTYIWRDRAAMAKAWSGMTGNGISMTFSIIDYPTTDATDWIEATGAALDVRQQTGKGFAVVSSLPELMPLDTATELMAGGVVPFMGLHEALSAVEAAAFYHAPSATPVTIPSDITAETTLTEAASKAALAAFGLRSPASCSITKGDDITAKIKSMTPPFAVKGTGLAHKSDSGAVKLGVMPEDLSQTIPDIGTQTVLVEEMISNPIAELLVGVVRDPAHGFVLTIGAGGVMTELLSDTASLLLPTTSDTIADALGTLKIAPLLNGFRGNPAADLTAITEAILSVQSYVLAHADHIGEVEINPLICTPSGAIAADALIRRS